MVDYSSRLQEAMTAAGVSTQALADHLGVSYQAVRKLEQGRSTAFKVANHLKAAAFLNVSPDWLSSGKGEKVPTVAANDDDFVEVPHAAVRFANGLGQVFFHDDDKPPLAFRAEFLRKMGIAKGHAVVVDCTGVSNEPKIADGSVVLLNRGDCGPLNGDFFGFRFDGELLIKRLDAIEGVGIAATAENPNFKPKMKIYTNADDFEIIGRAKWTGAVL